MIDIYIYIYIYKFEILFLKKIIYFCLIFYYRKFQTLTRVEKDGQSTIMSLYISRNTNSYSSQACSVLLLS